MHNGLNYCYSLQLCLRKEGFGLGGGGGYHTAAGPQTADENGRRDEKGDDKEGLRPWGHAQDMASVDLGWPSRNFKGLSMQQVIGGNHCG